MGNLTGAGYSHVEKLFRVPDAVGNLYRTRERNDRKYGVGGRLLESENAKYHYDEEGNLIAKVEDGKRLWRYLWNACGSLKEVVRPDYKSVVFEYDALGRRTAKIFDGRVTRWIWDGNTPLHEWSYDEKERPKTVTDEYGIKSKDREEPVENLITWIFEEGTFKPTAKLTENGNYSIITDYLGTPAQMYDEQGNLTWEADLDIYGRVRTFAGRSLNECPFRFQGQYFDEETGLAYNRFRYYDPDSGNYISQDPIGLAGNNPTIYAYVHDPNSWIDVFGLDEALQSSRAARREAMRQAGIPTSQQPLSQSKNKSGYEYTYEVPKAEGGTELKSVQQQTMDRSHVGEPHWEAGKVKIDEAGNPRMNDYGRPKLENEGKKKVNYGGCG
jgi:RHS repeat-associated protein